MPTTDSQGLRLLSLGTIQSFCELFLRLMLTEDGGGIRGLLTLLILQTIMHRIKAEEGLPEPPLPCEYFDLIGGSSTGG